MKESPLVEKKSTTKCADVFVPPSSVFIIVFPRFLSETYVSIVNEVIMVKDNYCVLKKERQRILFEIYLYVDFMLNSQLDFDS